MKSKIISSEKPSTAFLNPALLEATRLRILIRGAVQGVGFRPFVHRLAKELHLKGWVCNSAEGVTIEAEGPILKLDELLIRLHQDKPKNSFIQSFQYSTLDAIGAKDFQIVECPETTPKTAIVLPDIATCADCLKEIFDSRNRRHLYPFTTCTYCGPRYSIIQTLPYDRPNTVMRNFIMCPECQEEYEDPEERRFHSQPNACPTCGPHLELWDRQGNVLTTHHKALQQAVQAIQQGNIVALKGIGGFQLLVDACNDDAVRSLRARKLREEKPMAVMFPHLQDIEEYCEVSFLENYLLISREAPIVLLEKRRTTPAGKPIAHSVAANNPYLGAMLPYSPLHHILMRELGCPVVATSGNLADEPICIDEQEALVRLQEVADVFLVHNRPIVRHVDDSVVRLMGNRPFVVRRARGYAPLPIEIHSKGEDILAVGANLKNSIALVRGNNVFLSPPIGDLESSTAYESFKKTVSSFKEIYEPSLKKIACDLHPQYMSTQYAEYDQYPVTRVQHHHAHTVSCMAENDLNEEVLGIVWDTTGYGTDKTIWGGEFLLATLSDFKRVGHFRSFTLPGGEQSVKDPARSALGVLAEISPDNLEKFKFLPPFKILTAAQFKVLQKMLDSRNPIRTSSVGRLFDAVASLLGLQQRIYFENQAAMSLEYAIQNERTDAHYEYEISEEKGSKLWVVDWAPMISQIIKEIQKDIYQSLIAAKFHNTLVEMAVSVVKLAKHKKVVISGGCFQNKYLSERLIVRLKEEGFHPYWHQWVPPDDSGIALGQAVVALNRTR